jgi:hypothetical protein
MPLSVLGVPGDVNGDGKLDLIEAHRANVSGKGGGVSVWIGGGDGSFTGPVSYDVRDPNLIVTGDLTGDGKDDIVAVSNAAPDTQAATFSVLLNHGDGTFAAAVEYPATNAPVSVKLADLDGDHKTDLVIASLETFTVFLNLGHGTFAPGVGYAINGNGVIGGFFDFAIGDLTADGKPEIVLLPNGVDALSLFLNQGDGSFVQDVYLPTSGGPYGALVVDLNEDGKGDLFVTSLSSTFVLLNEGVPFFAAPIRYGDGYNAPVFAADFNGDGHADIACSTGVATGHGDGTFSPLVIPAAPTSMAIAPGDVNGDGKPDIVFWGGVLVNTTP